MEHVSLHSRVERLTETFTVEARRVGAEFGLLPVHLHVLHYLSTCNRFSNTASAVTEYLGQTKGPVSQTLNVLQRKGLLVKVPDDHDRRVVRLQLTEEGLAVVERASTARPLQSVRDRLGAKRIEEIEDALDDLTSVFLEAAGLKSFGSCPSCSHYRTTAKETYFCELVEQPLTSEDLKLRCVECRVPSVELAN